MPILVCDKCNYETNKPYRMKNHFNKKNLCSREKVYINKDIMDLIELEGVEVLTDIIDLIRPINKE